MTVNTIPRTCTVCGTKFFSNQANINKGGGRHCKQACVVRGNKIPDIDRFFKGFTKTEYCWPWNRPQGRGYGSMMFRGKTEKAHRISYIIHKGAIPDDLYVLHTCDNPPCVNPNHLFLGTQEDNVHDMHAKKRDRHPSGISHWRSKPGLTLRPRQYPSPKLTEQQVREMRHLYKSGTEKSIAAIGRKFNISRELAHQVIRRKLWKHA